MVSEHLPSPHILSHDIPLQKPPKSSFFMVHYGTGRPMYHTDNIVLWYKKELKDRIMLDVDKSWESGDRRAHPHLSFWVYLGEVFK